MSSPLAPRFILTAVGTDHHPFGRLVDWVDEWFDGHARSVVDGLVQRGVAPAPASVPSQAYLDPAALFDSLRRADAVVCHGGPSTIMEARAAGIFPVVVARDPAYGEHVDSHQLAFTARLAADGVIRLVDGRQPLWSALDEILVDPHAHRLAGQAVDTQAIVDRIGGLIDELMAGRSAQTRRLAS